MAATRAPTVLLVDDEPDILSSMRMMFDRLLPDVRLRTAGSGAEALRLLAAERMDLIVTDYRMPEMDGLEFLRRAEDFSPDAPRVILTAFPKLAADMAQVDLRIERVIAKPLAPDLFMDAVESLLGLRSKADPAPAGDAPPGRIGLASASGAWVP